MEEKEFLALRKIHTQYEATCEEIKQIEETCEMLIDSDDKLFMMTLLEIGDTETINPLNFLTGKLGMSLKLPVDAVMATLAHVLKEVQKRKFKLEKQLKQQGLTL